MVRRAMRLDSNTAPMALSAAPWCVGLCAWTAIPHQWRCQRHPWCVGLCAWAHEITLRTPDSGRSLRRAAHRPVYLSGTAYCHKLGLVQNREQQSPHCQ
jgi:hypothetical protein